MNAEDFCGDAEDPTTIKGPGTRFANGADATYGPSDVNNGDTFTVSMQVNANFWERVGLSCPLDTTWWN